MVQLPAARYLTVVPETEQMVGVAEAKETVNPDVAVAETEPVPVALAALSVHVKVIDCGFFATVTDCVTAVAGAQVPFPP